MKKRELQDLATNIEKSTDFTGFATIGSDVPPYKVMSSGSLSVDYVTGVGGITKGIQVELYGKPSVGKTSLCYYMMAQAQKEGKGAGFIGLEAPYNPEHAELFTDIDSDQVIAITPLSGEDAAEALYLMVMSGKLSLIVFDSLGAMLDSKEQDTGTRKVGGQSGLITMMSKRILRPCWQNECTVVYINQVRSAMIATNASLLKTPGGHNLEHAVSLRIEMKSVYFGEKDDRAPYFDEVDGEKKKIGERVAITVTKNKANSSAGRTAQYDFWTDTAKGHIPGIDREQEVIDLAMRLQVLEKKGSFYAHPLFPKSLQGKKAVSAFLKSNPEIMEQVRRELIEKSVTRSVASTNGNG